MQYCLEPSYDPQSIFKKKDHNAFFEKHSDFLGKELSDILKRILKVSGKAYDSF